jgi:hypothetical protein
MKIELKIGLIGASGVVIVGVLTAMVVDPFTKPQKHQFAARELVAKYAAEHRDLEQKAQVLGLDR